MSDKPPWDSLKTCPGLNSEKMVRQPLAQLPLLQPLSAEELQVARESPELHQGDLYSQFGS